MQNTNCESQCPTLVSICKTILSCARLVLTLADHCRSMVNKHKAEAIIADSLNNTSSMTGNDDHSYGCGNSYSSKLYLRTPRHHSLDTNSYTCSPPVVSDNDAGDGNSVVIDSMSTEVLNCMDEPIDIQQSNSLSELSLDTDSMQIEQQIIESCLNASVKLSMEGKETEQLDTSDDSIVPPKYNPTGTHLVQKKRKPILLNPEKTVTEMWKKDALSHKWTILLPKLDAR